MNLLKGCQINIHHPALTTLASSTLQLESKLFITLAGYPPMSGSRGSLSATLSLSLTLLQPCWPLHYSSNKARLSPPQRVCIGYLFYLGVSTRLAPSQVKCHLLGRPALTTWFKSPSNTKFSFSAFIFPCIPYHLLEEHILFM